MSRFTGPQRKGAMGTYREVKRLEAEQRKTLTHPADTRLGRRARDGELDPTLYLANGTRRVFKAASR